MASLTKSWGTETYDDPQFAGSGPIDCMYVVGAEGEDRTGPLGGFAQASEFQQQVIDDQRDADYDYS